VHLHQSERFHVCSEAMKVMIADEEQVLREGDEVLVPAGTPHRW
jgi:mannose-6-phosphate isomerase-like protein (cupin superfamily)